MRILHTSDWHLGHTLREHAREGEHARFLAWLIEVLEAEQVDALLVTGDIFDSTNPSAQAQQAWYGFLAAVRRRLPGLQVLALAGNHDSAHRLEAPNAILAALDIRVVGALRRRDERLVVDDLVVPLRDRSGAVRAWAALVPFLRPADLPHAAEPELDPLVEGVRAVYREACAEALRRREPGQALIATGHVYMVGGAVSEVSERKILGGNQHALPVDIFPPEVAYAALGHLHLAQRVGRAEHVRYAGSPLPLSMAEAGYVHQVYLIDLDGAGVAAGRALPVPRAAPMLRVPGEGAAGIEEVLGMLVALEAPRALPEEEWPFLEVVVKVTAPVPAMVARIEEAIAPKGVRLVRVHKQLGGTGRSLSEARAGVSLGDLTPEQVFRERYARDHEGEPSGELLAAFHELLGEALGGRDG